MAPDLGSSRVKSTTTKVSFCPGNRDRPKFGFGFGFGTETDGKSRFGLVSVSVLWTGKSFGFGQNCVVSVLNDRNWLAGLFAFNCPHSSVTFKPLTLTGWPLIVIFTRLSLYSVGHLTTTSECRRLAGQSHLVPWSGSGCRGWYQITVTA